MSPCWLLEEMLNHYSRLYVCVSSNRIMSKNHQVLFIINVAMIHFHAKLVSRACSYWWTISWWTFVILRAATPVVTNAGGIPLIAPGFSGISKHSPLFSMDMLTTSKSGGYFHLQWHRLWVAGAWHRSWRSRRLDIGLEHIGCGDGVGSGFLHWTLSTLNSKNKIMSFTDK